MIRPQTRYAKSADVHIAYQIVGNGPIDIVFVQGFISNLEVQWEDPGLTHLFNRLGAFARLIVFDKRGSGLSDRVNDMPNLETRMDDVRAVMDAAGSQQAALIGASEGGPMSILFAATYPQRTRALILYGAYAHFYSWVLSPEQVEAFVAAAEENWGTGSSLKSFAPNLVSDDRFRTWWARFERLGTSPAGAIALARMNGQIDVRGLLPAVRVPTLIIHRDHDARVNVAAGRYLAASIAGSKHVEIPGVDHPIWVGDTDRVVDEIEEFLTGVRPVPVSDRVLATVLCVEVADAARRRDRPWLDRMARFREIVSLALAQYRGREIGRRPDGTAAIFDGPVRAVRCIIAIREGARQLDMALHGGIHTGEVEIAGEEVGGSAVHLVARIAAVARADEVLVSTTVRDIVPGSGLHFLDAGDRLSAGEDTPRLLVLDADGGGPTRRTTVTHLSPREREILVVLARGLTNAEIAENFDLSEHTVKRHVTNILTKLDLANRSAAAAFAVQHRLSLTASIAGGCAERPIAAWLFGRCAPPPASSSSPPMQTTGRRAMAVDETRLNSFLGRMVGDMGATMSAALVIVGDKLGLYKAMAEAGPMDPAELARRTGTTERCVREWLAAQAASGYVAYEASTGTFHLEPEQAMVFAEEGSPAFLAGFFEVAEASFRAVPKVIDAFRSGRGVGWHEHHRCLFCGTERFFRTSYSHHLVGEWLPALDGVVEKLRRGAKVADVGCGHGASTILMAKEYSDSHFFGFDYHLPSIEQARLAAQTAGVADRVSFDVAAAKDFPASGYDLVTCFDCLHDMGDPVGAAGHIKAALKPDGTWLIVEPFAHDCLADNLNPVGRIYYAASTMICTQASLSQDVGLALGAQAGELRLREAVTTGGFSRFRRATETPFNLVLEARP